MRTLDDSLALSERASAASPMVVIGTGFIGCEIAGSLAMRGDAVTLIGAGSAAAGSSGWARAPPRASPAGWASSASS